MKPVTLGLIVGNRGFFPSHLCETGRAEVLQVLSDAGINVVTLSPEDTTYGSIESLEDARKCAELFDQHRKEIDGVLVTLPNFGDERAIANALRWSGLNVPVLIHAFPDDAENMTIADRRDSFCGKMSVCNNLRQYGIPYSLTTLHTVSPSHPSFQQDLANFVATCRVTSSLRGLRLGALGARPAAFNTVRYSEKLLEENGISVETLDLFELFGWVNAMADDDPAVQAKLQAIQDYVQTANVPGDSLVKMAKFGVAVDNWMQENRLQASAIQCWTAMEEFFGVVPCTLMSMMSNDLIPSACEVDIMGALAMYVLAQASQKPSAIVDWNNNYGDDPDKGVVFHCSNLPRDIFKQEGEDQPSMFYQEIIAGTVGAENTYGTIYGRINPNAFTYLRISTDDGTGTMRAYVGEGEFTDDPLLTFGGYGVVRVPEFQKLLQYICNNGFEHHVSVNPSQTAAAVHEALTKYKGWDVYRHS
ncbi:L-fucose/L-arabinose isomerase family protein [Litorilinea aerophila]|nr:L-fucose/L-arabinose isomerase family protein [Litorilinea aerophila]MCC9076422.1 L-fucose/L-arabinose isomerase family protein [Litorilinea aerophila]